MTSAAVEGFISRPIEPGYFVGPQPTSRMRGKAAPAADFSINFQFLVHARAMRDYTRFAFSVKRETASRGPAVRMRKQNSTGPRRRACAICETMQRPPHCGGRDPSAGARDPGPSPLRLITQGSQDDDACPIVTGSV